MSNECLLICEIVVVFSLLLATKYFFGKIGVLCWVAVASIIANVEVAKNISVAGIYATLGNVMFASNFLATDILSECYGMKYARLAPKIGVFAVIVYMINMQIALMYTPNEIDIVSTSMNNMFQFAPQICFASVLMYFLSNYFDVIIYEKLKKYFKGKKLWLRNNIATILCNCSENFGFAFIAFYGTFNINDILMIAISTSIIETFIAICDTPFLYLAKFIRR